jgi:hypothetical protein
MREMRVTLLVGVMMFCLLGAYSVGHAGEDPAKLVEDGIRALEAGRPAFAEEKFREALEVDGNNYHALVLLGQLEAASDEIERPDKNLDAENYFLKAAIAQPHRPEAYLALTQLYYSQGYVKQGDQYARIAQDVDPMSYEAFCLLGQRYEDSGNYAGALSQYMAGLEVFGFDSYLVYKRYLAASLGGLTPHKVLPVHVDSSTIYYVLVPTSDYRDMKIYRRQAGKAVPTDADYKLPTFTFKYCPQERITAKGFRDNYEAFLKASVKDEAEYRKLKSEIERIRNDALKHISGISGTKAKSKALYDWLKANVLKNYDIEEGILAQDVLKEHKYLCLNASILYALIGQEAGLPIYGMITPGHAYAMVQDGRREIQVELTAEPMFGMTREQGFDVDWWEQFKVLNRVDAYGGLKGFSRNRNIGKVEPTVLTAYQFVNTDAHNKSEITEQYKEEIEYLKTLKSMLQKTIVEAKKARQSIYGKYSSEPEKMYALWARADAKYFEKNRQLRNEIFKIKHKIEKELADYQYSKGMDLIRQARAMAPSVEEFAGMQERYYSAMKDALLEPVLQDQADRKLRMAEIARRFDEKNLRLRFLRKISSTDSEILEDLEKERDKRDAEIRLIEEEARKNWSEAKELYFKALEPLEKGLDELPCSSMLKREYESLCWTIAREAELYEDPEALAQIAAMGMARLPASDFAKFYRQREMTL